MLFVPKVSPLHASLVLCLSLFLAGTSHIIKLSNLPRTVLPSDIRRMLRANQVENVAKGSVQAPLKHTLTDRGSQCPWTTTGFDQPEERISL